MIIDDLKREKKFKEAIGDFVIHFSELEFGLAKLCALTECSIFTSDEKNKNLKKYMGSTFVKKVETLSTAINENIPELQEIWNKIEPEIKEINNKRRYIIHGIINYQFQEEITTAHIKTKKQISTENLDIETINKLTVKISSLNTGIYGINGKFNTLFTKAIVDRWNNLVNDKYKIIYTVNSEILSEWKGK